MKFEIKSQLAGSVLFTAELPDEYENERCAVQLGAAVKLAVQAGADLRGAGLRGADLRCAYLRGAGLRGAGLRGADLRGADLRGADLGGADLGDADLGDADLRGADLRGANLRGANLRGAGLIDGGQDQRGYRFVGIPHDDGLRISAGCRWFAIAEAREHWSGDDRKTNAECRERVEMIVRIARLRGGTVGDEAEAA